MHGNPEIQPYTEDCANCPSCRAFAIIVRQYATRGEMNLLEAIHELVEWMVAPAPGIDPEERGAQLDCDCVMNVAGAATWISEAPAEQILARANDVGLERPEIELLWRRMKRAAAGSSAVPPVRPGSGAMA